MTAQKGHDPELAATMGAMRARDESFAVATIVRTAGATAAKPGAKVLLRADGTVLHGWLGGACVAKAIAAAVARTMATGKPELISVAPDRSLTARGLEAGDERDGVRFARNGCPSEGTIDIFIEPCLPRPELVVFGESPVAQAIDELAPRFDWEVVVSRPGDALPAAASDRRRVIVVATQGEGDLNALRAALAHGADHVAFVGSRRKFAALAKSLEERGAPKDRIEAVRAPAGLDIGAVTPEEIALSILAELTLVRRRAQRDGKPDE